jgi:hypothetical protein
MEDTRVTFETAKLAKGKGFPQETNRLEIPYYNYKGEFKGDVSDWRVRKYIRGEDTSDVESVSAPTQSLLAKWLRKEHNLHINICSLSMNCFSFMLEKLNDTGTTLCGGHLGKINYKTYEEAYEIGLQEALKLI